MISNFTSVLDSVERVVQSLHLGSDFFRLDGKVIQKRREEMVNAFNRPSDPRRVFLLSSKAGGVGLNLIGASRLIMMDCDWNPAIDKQAMGRIWRPGQTRPVVIYRLVALNTLEHTILQVNSQQNCYRVTNFFVKT